MNFIRQIKVGTNSILGPTSKVYCLVDINSVAEDKASVGADSPAVVKPGPLNYFLSWQVWRPWAD